MTEGVIHTRRLTQTGEKAPAESLILRTDIRCNDAGILHEQILFARVQNNALSNDDPVSLQGGELLVVKDFYVGATRIIIDDEYCDKTEEETKQRLDRIAFKAYENMVAYEYEKQKKNQQAG